MTKQLGTISKLDDPQKLEHCGVELFYQEEQTSPLVSGCIAWLVCKLIPEPHNQSAHDLFIGSVVGAWADSRVLEMDTGIFRMHQKNFVACTILLVERFT